MTQETRNPERYFDPLCADNNLAIAAATFRFIRDTVSVDAFDAFESVLAGQKSWSDVRRLDAIQVRGALNAILESRAVSWFAGADVFDDVRGYARAIQNTDDRDEFVDSDRATGPVRR